MHLFPIDRVLYRDYTIIMEIQSFQDKFICMINKFNNLDSLEIEYVHGVNISHSDVHLLTLMLKHPYKKVSELAELFGVTKGAVSQKIKKMGKRGLINRVRRADNYKEVYIELTDIGKKAVKKHDEYEKLSLINTGRILGEMSLEQQFFLLTVIDKLTKDFEEAEERIKRII